MRAVLRYDDCLPNVVNCVCELKEMTDTAMELALVGGFPREVIIDELVEYRHLYDDGSSQWEKSFLDTREEIVDGVLNAVRSSPPITLNWTEGDFILEAVDTTSVMVYYG